MICFFEPESNNTTLTPKLSPHFPSLINHKATYPLHCSTPQSAAGRLRLPKPQSAQPEYHLEIDRHLPHEWQHATSLFPSRTNTHLRKALQNQRPSFYRLAQPVSLHAASQTSVKVITSQFISIIEIAVSSYIWAKFTVNNQQKFALKPFDSSPPPPSRPSR